MMNSKALKRWKLPKEPKTKLGKAYKTVSDFVLEHLYYPVENIFIRYRERVKRSFDYAVLGWLQYDFDSGFVYELMSWKLKRVYECLENGHAIQKKENMDALKEAIKICDRLFRSEYDEQYYKVHDKKWGKLKTWFTPVEGSTCSQWNSSRPKANTPKRQEQERKDHRQIWVNEENDRLADLDRLNEILKKYEPSWWD